MAHGCSDKPATYELPLPTGSDPALPSDAGDRDSACLSPPLLAEHALWLCRLRWAVVVVLVGFGVLGLFPVLRHGTYLRLRADWPLAMAGVVAVYNLVVLGYLRALRKPGRLFCPTINLWGQIVLDLVFLTAVVHFVGSRDTFIAFVYLFHIVMACIFFSRPQSLAVTALAGVLYLACVAAEEMTIIPAANSVYVPAPTAGHAKSFFAPAILNPVSALGVWLVVWYLASHLSTMVRRRDRELARANSRLAKALEERETHMLRTTHELKAPFAAIHANTQILLRGRCGTVAHEVREILDRISERCRMLGKGIRDMLQLANLGSASQTPPPRVKLDLAAVLRWCMAEVEPVAEQRRIVLEENLQPVCIDGVEDHLRMFFSNLLSNAIAYSHDGGRVRISCPRDEPSACVVAIADDGIGIAAEKLPHIFDEHYRTEEAVRHNRGSSGLGLAIVRQIAQTHGIGVRVTSSQRGGTTFRLRLPAGQPQGGTEGKETRHGVCADRG